MKKIFFLGLFLLNSLIYSQYASSSFITLNEGMENSYLEIEKLWSEYHKEAIKNGHKTSWAIWKIDQYGLEDKIEKDRYPNYVIIETYSNLKQLEEEFARYDEDGIKKITNFIKGKLKGKISSSKVDKILSQTVEKERRTYIHEGIAATPFTGGSLKPGDKMTIAPMEQLKDDYESFETDFYQKIFADNVMKGNHRWWGFTRIINRSDNALTFNTHVAWNIGIEGKEIEIPDDFVSRKIIEITPESRKMYNPINLELVYREE